MGGNRELVLLVGAVVATFAWWATYTILGGKFPAPFPLGPVTWGMRWRSFAAGIVALGFFSFVVSFASRQ